MSAFGELKFIHWIERRFGSSHASGSVGDDAAVFETGAARRLLLKTDALVEGVHFKRTNSTPDQWGWKVVMKNASDMAAMGGEPTAFLLALGVPAGTSEELVRGIYRGIERACRRTGCRLVGGDTTRASQIFLAGSMVGRPGPQIFYRNGARPGDWVFVTGALGSSYKTGHHLSFKPRLDASRFLSRHYPVRAAMDLSDGLAKDLREIARKSHIGFCLDGSAIPLRMPQRGLWPAFEEGEDFELLFCLSPKEGERLLADGRARRAGLDFFQIGRAVPRRMGLKVIDRRGCLRDIPDPHCHHFGRSSRAAR